MKNLIATLLLLAIALTVAVDAGSRNRKHRSNVRDDENDSVDESPDWPSPDQIHHFEVPEIFTQGVSNGDSAYESDQSTSENHPRPPARGHGHRRG